MPSTDATIHWDARPDQVGVVGNVTPESLKDAGWEYIANDPTSVPGFGIVLFKLPNTNKWLVALVSNGKIVGSALVYSSGDLGTVVREFAAVHGVVA